MMNHGTRYLDGLRGFAALIVLAGHCSNSNMHLIPGIDLTSTAKCGVWLFFVLSAYLLTVRLVTCVQKDGFRRSVVQYAIRRLFRILPLFYVVLLGYLMFGLMVPAQFVRHILLTEGSEHFWTIPVEMSFYAVLPIICGGLCLVRPSRRLAAAGVVFMGSFFIYWAAGPQAIGRNGLGLLNYAPFFAAGILCAFLPVTVRHRGVAFAIGLMTMVLAPLFAPRMVAYLAGNTIARALETSWVWAVLWGVLLATLLSGSAARRVFDTALLRFLGLVSFGLYLVHYQIILAMRDAGFSGTASGWAAALLSIAMAAALHWLIEARAQLAGGKYANAVA